jgi:hypothetical protein
MIEADERTRERERERERERVLNRITNTIQTCMTGAAMQEAHSKNKNR